MDEMRRLIAERKLPPPGTRRILREIAGLQVSELAERLGVGRQCVWRWEKGHRTPQGANRERYAAFLEAARESILES